MNLNGWASGAWGAGTWFAAAWGGEDQIVTAPGDPALAPQRWPGDPDAIIAELNQRNAVALLLLAA